jgi:hypothetical protein
VFFLFVLLAEPNNESTSLKYMKQAEESGLYAKE